MLEIEMDKNFSKTKKKKNPKHLGQVSTGREEGWNGEWALDKKQGEVAQEEKSAEHIWGEANPAPLGKLPGGGRSNFPITATVSATGSTCEPG